MEDFLPINGTDHVELYVGNAKQASSFYQHVFGFELIAYAGPETGVRDRSSFVLQQGKVRLVLTSPLHADSEISQHIQKHGDAVKVLALTVDDATKAFHETTIRGAIAAREPQTLKDDSGEVVMASIRTYGDTIHTFVERKKYKGPFLPGYAPRKSAITVLPIGLQYIDHCVGNVALSILGGEDYVIIKLCVCAGHCSSLPKPTSV